MNTSVDVVDLTVRQRVAAARRIVIKMGTNVIMRDDGAPAIGLVYGIVESAVNVLRLGRQVLIVSSGAIGLGAKSLRLEKSPSELALKQACAAVGQSRLMSMYRDGFRHFNVTTAQVLLTEDDFLNPVRYSNLRATLDTLLKLGVVPIINENDTVSTLELDRPGNASGQHRVFGDNDKLSALVMTKIDADLLVLLSDVDGLYTSHPQDDGAELVSEVEEITPELAAYARISKGRGRGGMSTKIEAARIVAEAGKVTVIANGRIPGVVERVVAGEAIGTVFHPRLTARRGPRMNTAVATPVLEIAQSAKTASRLLSTLPTAAKDEALEAIASALEASADSILAANLMDVRGAEPLVRTGELSQSLFQRLLLSEEKLRVMIEGVRAVKQLPDPSGRTLERTLLADGLTLEKISVPLGVVAVIFEARPDAITQISALAIKSGNAVILKGGREVENTMRAILDTMHSRVPADAVSGVYGRESVQALLDANQLIDLVIPRGANALVQHIQRNTLIPVLGHADGVCHIFIDQAADPEMVNRIVVDSKTQYPAVCNAVETVLIHAAVAAAMLPSLVQAMEEKSVKIRGCERTRSLLPGVGIDHVLDTEWHTEYSDLVLAIRIVNSLDDALAHIDQYGSHHTDAIITQDTTTAARFLAEVDSANVLHNCSTRFSDGFRYGFGAEVGISTSKLHARGPVGLDGIVTYKYRLAGSGHIVRDYAGANALPFLHQRLKLD